MPWASTAVSVGSSLLGGAFGGGNKKAERAAKDAAARAQYAQEEARASANAKLQPFVTNGTSASNELAYLLGVGGYDVAKPTFEDAYNQVRSDHFKYFGKDYNRNSNVADERAKAQRILDQKTQEWQKGFDEFKANQGADSRFGSLNKEFTNEDFVKDSGYLSRLLEGEQGVNRNLVARGSSDSGQALKELERYRQMYASNEFGNAFARDNTNKLRTYNNLQGMATQGLGAIGTSIGVGQNAASNIGNSQQNLAGTLLGNARQDADNQSNAFQSAISNLLYGINRNSSSGRTPDYFPAGGSSRDPSARLYV